MVVSKHAVLCGVTDLQLWSVERLIDMGKNQMKYCKQQLSHINVCIEHCTFIHFGTSSSGCESFTKTYKCLISQRHLDNVFLKLLKH